MADRIKEVYGRMLSGLAGPSGDEQLRAYEKALGVGKARIKPPTKSDIEVKRMGEWKDPDAGIDVFDFTTDLIPDMPAMALGAIGAITGGPAAAVPLAAIGNIAKQQFAKDIGLRDELSRPEMVLEGGAELLGPIGDALPLAAIGRTVWHGSPHRGIKKFDLGKIGTGEGAQAYGHGQYVAEAKDVAGTYRFNPENRAKIQYRPYTEYKGKDIGLYPYNERKYLQHLDEAGSVNEAIRLVPEWEQQLRAIDERQMAKKWEEIIPKESAGSLYEVDLPDEHIDRMLDWDKPLSEQPKNIRDAIRTIADKHDPTGILDEMLQPFEAGATTGRSIHMALENSLAAMGNGQPSKTTALLLEKYGIPGIKYLDGTSRATGEGSRNYVVFDTDLLEILSEN